MLVFAALKPIVGPTFTTPLSNVMARAGQKIKLECCIAGSPASLVWTHDGKPLKETRDLKVCLPGRFSYNDSCNTHHFISYFDFRLRLKMERQH